MGALIIVIFVCALIIFYSYNGLVVSKNKVKNAWSQIDVQLQRRFDLIPNLVESVKGYMEHEKSVLEKVTELRTSWANAGSIAEKAELDNQLSGALKTIMSVSENYPELKANQQYLDLQNKLSQIEDELQYARHIYNNEVTKYNNMVETVPSSMVAKLFAFDRAELFRIEDENKDNVDININ